MALDIATILLQWQQVGVFDFLLPFLLIFAIIFGILSTTHIVGENKGIHVVIAFVIALMALQLNFVSDFYRELFPRLGVGIAILVVILILVGLFIAQEEMRYWGWGLGAIGFIIALVIVSKSFDQFGWYSNSSWSDSAGWIIGAVLLIGIIIAIAASGSKGGGGDSGKASYGPIRGGH